MTKLLPKKLLSSIVVLLLSAVLVAFFPEYFSKTKFTQDVLPISATENIAIFRQPVSGKPPILNAIKDAKSEILVEVYLLTDKDVIAALGEANQRGVAVKVMMEEHPYLAVGLNQATNKLLAAKNISVKWTSDDYSLTHEKAMIIDRQKLLVLNQNLTAVSFQKNREYNVIDTDPTDVALAAKIFDSDWERQAVELTPSHLVVSPYNSRSTLEDLLKNSSQTIDMELEVVNDPEIENLIKDLAKTREIRVILADFSKIEANKSVAEEFADAGVQVKTLKTPYVHAKLLIIDKKNAYIGSINFTTQSMDENRELGIVISQSKALEELNADFASDWLMAK